MRMNSRYKLACKRLFLCISVHLRMHATDMEQSGMEVRLYTMALDN